MVHGARGVTVTALLLAARLTYRKDTAPQMS